MNYKHLISKKKYWIIGAVVLIVIAYAFLRKDGAPNLEIVKVERRTITQEVSATGNVKPAQSVDLAFETSGRVNTVNAKVSDIIGAGQTIASIDSSELQTQLDKADADLNSQKVAFEKAKTDLDNYYGDVINTINSVYTSANDAVRLKIDSLFIDDETNNPKLAFDPTSSQAKSTSESQRVIIGDMLDSWLADINSLQMSSPQNILEQKLADSKVNLSAIYTFLNFMMDTVINSQLLSASTLNTYKTSINDARAEMDSAISTATTLAKNISSQKATVASKEADIKSYEANVENIKAKISKTFLRSPIYGIITKQDAKVGEIVTANSKIASVISSGSYEIDSYIPEVDIARVKIGDSARITLDAYGNEVTFEAAITSIDPGETVIEGVSTYLTKLHFKKPDSRIKSGMTANIDIVSARHENVLSVPQRAVQKETGKEFVMLYKETKDKNSSSTEKTIVTTGLRGVDGYIEILSGLTEGEKIVIPRLAK